MAKRKGLSFKQKKKLITPNFVHELLSWVFFIGMSVLLAFVIVYLFGMQVRLVGLSMEPTLHNGQTVFVNRFVYKILSPRVGDIIAFLPNGNKNSHYYIKRVVAVSGDEVVIRDGILYVNEIPIEGDFDKIADPGIAANPIHLGRNEYFVLGDNCNNSEDSRSSSIGGISKDTIVGKVWFHGAYAKDFIGFVR